MNPEFLREGTSIKDFDDPPFTVIGAEDDRTAKTVASLYAGLKAPVQVVSLARGGDGQVRLQQLPRAEGRVRQRDRQHLQGAQRRQPRGDADLLRGHEAQHLADVPAAGLRVRRLVPAEGSSRALVSRPPARRRHAGAGRGAVEQREADRARVRHGARDRLRRTSACSASPSRRARTTCASRRS